MAVSRNDGSPQEAPPRANERTRYDSLGLRISRDGIWYYHGSPIQRKELVCLFASALQRDEAGRYWLITPREIAPIEVEDVPFLAVELFVAGSGQDRVLSFRTNVDEIVTVGEGNPLRVVTDAATGQPSPYVALDGGLEARLTRAVFYELVALGENGNGAGADGMFGVWSSGRFFALGPAGDIA
jgi:hypothetical protein